MPAPTTATVPGSVCLDMSGASVRPKIGGEGLYARLLRLAEGAVGLGVSELVDMGNATRASGPCADGDLRDEAPTDAHASASSCPWQRESFRLQRRAARS